MVGRKPKGDGTATRAIQIRLDETTGGIFDALVAARQEELRKEGATVTGPDVLRWLVIREAEARGLIPAPKKEGKPTRKPAK